MSRVIRAFYLDNNRTTAIAIILEVQRVCAANGVKPPSHMTIRARIRHFRQQTTRPNKAH